LFWTGALKALNDLDMSDTLHLIFSTRGGVTAVARALNISLPAVSQWREKGEIPKSRREAAHNAIEAHVSQLGGPVAQQEPAPGFPDRLAAYHGERG
jgi:hypothetical protein